MLLPLLRKSDCFTLFLSCSPDCQCIRRSCFASTSLSFLALNCPTLKMPVHFDGEFPLNSAFTELHLVLGSPTLSSGRTHIWMSLLFFKIRLIWYCASPYVQGCLRILRCGKVVPLKVIFYYVVNFRNITPLPSLLLCIPCFVRLVRICPTV